MATCAAKQLTQFGTDGPNCNAVPFCLESQGAVERWCVNFASWLFQRYLYNLTSNPNVQKRHE